MRSIGPGAAKRFVLLDGLRGIAALLVITDHIPSALSDLVPGRALAVDFFFVLSGFVLVHAYGPDLDHGMPRLAFLRARLIRLYPFYILASCAGALLPLIIIVKGWQPITPAQLAVVFAFATAFVPMPPLYFWTGGAAYPLVGPAWSLFFELAANLAFACASPLRRKSCLSIYLPAAAIAFLIVNLTWGTFDLGWRYDHFLVGGFRIGFDFFAGVFVYGLWKREVGFRISACTAVISLVLIAMLPALFPYRLFVVGTTLLQIFAIPLLVLGAANCEVKRWTGGLSKFLGTHSYGVYVLQAPIISLSPIMLPSIFPAPSGMAFLGFVAATTLLAACIVYYMWDVPVRAWLTCYWDRAPIQNPATHRKDAN
jgi:peptidoglycan/LPS O-acetylase OafA/YrhL